MVAKTALMRCQAGEGYCREERNEYLSVGDIPRRER